jgi:hypothetical protein
MESAHDAKKVLTRLVGKEIPTLTGRPNRVLRVEGANVIVATSKSPRGKPVPLAEIQEAIDRLVAQGEIEISVRSVGYRSAFIGAVLSTLPGATTATSPRRVSLKPT